MSILEYEFMRRAFLVGGVIAIIMPCIGTIVVLKRLSMIGDALSHTSLAGVAAGLVMGINPIVGSMVACIAAAFGIEAIRKKIPQYAEISIAVMMSVGIGLAGVLSGFVKGSANFNSFLFGSIVLISDFELALVVGVSVVVLLAFVCLYKELFLVAMDERSAKLSGVPVGTVNFIFTIMTAITVSVAARTVGALIVSSLMVIPFACATQIAKSYRQTILYSIMFALIFTVGGLTISYYWDLKPGGTTVLLGVAILLITFGAKEIFKKIHRKRINKKQAQ